MADTVLFQDNSYGTIATGLAVGDTSISLTSGHGARFPAVTTGQVLYATLVNSSNVVEQIHITAHTANSDTLTVTRAANGTAAKVWNSGDRIEVRLTSEFLQEISNAGEYIESVVASTNAPTTGQYKDLTSIALTAGDWDVTAVVYYSKNGATLTIWDFGIGTVTGNDSTGLVAGSTQITVTAPSATTGGLSIANVRVSLSGSAIRYLKFGATYSAGNPIAYGRLSARRIR